jgi:hypothetical protein
VGSRSETLKAPANQSVPGTRKSSMRLPAGVWSMDKWNSRRLSMCRASERRTCRTGNIP